MVGLFYFLGKIHEFTKDFIQSYYNARARLHSAYGQATQIHESTLKRYGSAMSEEQKTQLTQNVQRIKKGIKEMLEHLPQHRDKLISVEDELRELIVSTGGWITAMYGLGIGTSVLGLLLPNQFFNLPLLSITSSVIAYGVYSFFGIWRDEERSYKHHSAILMDIHEHSLVDELLKEIIVGNYSKEIY